MKHGQNTDWLLLGWRIRIPLKLPPQSERTRLAKSVFRPCSIRG